MIARFYTYFTNFITTANIKQSSTSFLLLQNFGCLSAPLFVMSTPKISGTIKRARRCCLPRRNEIGRNQNEANILCSKSFQNNKNFNRVKKKNLTLGNSIENINLL